MYGSVAACCCGLQPWSGPSTQKEDGARRYPRRQVRPAPEDRPAESELQATFAGGVGQGLDAAVEPVARAVEGNLLDAGSLGTLGDQRTHLGGGVGVLAVLQAFLDVGLQGIGGGNHLRAIGG